MIKARLIRKWFYEEATMGQLFFGEDVLYTLEDRVRAPGVKIYGETAIPAGSYKVTLYNSPHFKRVLPRLEDVPNFSYILFHSGVNENNTKGCILLGTRADMEAHEIHGGLIEGAEQKFKDWVTQQLEAGDLYVDIVDAPMVDARKGEDGHSDVI